MNESDNLAAHSTFHMCMMAEEHDEALKDVMALAKPASELDLNAAVGALAEIHEIVKDYLGV